MSSCPGGACVFISLMWLGVSEADIPQVQLEQLVQIQKSFISVTLKTLKKQERKSSVISFNFGVGEDL